MTNTLTTEEENAVRYVEGYVVWVISQKVKDKDVQLQHILDELKDNDDTEGPAQDWVRAID